MKRLTIFLFFILMIFAISFANAAGQRMDAPTIMAMTEKNGDGLIDREEYHQRMTEVFFLADMDKDGNLTINEIQAVEDVDPRAFEGADRDGSHSLSIYEYHYAVHKDFNAADRNYDGTIDMEELKLMIKK